MSGESSTRLSLLLRLRSRADELSWPEFHQRYGQLLYRYARARGASHADAEDVVQEVELALFKALEGFEYDARKGRFRGYLRTAVVHALARRAGRDARRPDALDPQALAHVSGEDDAELDRRWEREWQLNRLRWAMREVAGDFEPQTLKAFELHVLSGEPADATAATTGLSRDSVYQAKSRVLKALRAKLAEVDPDGDV